MNEYNLKYFARKLRSNMTQHEQMLWSRIRKKQIHGLQFYRQKRIAGYIVDFYCPAVMLVIEIDGQQHKCAINAEYDRVRTQILNSIGLAVLRFDNYQLEIKIELVVAEILNWLNKHPTHPPFREGRSNAKKVPLS